MYNQKTSNINNVDYFFFVSLKAKKWQRWGESHVQNIEIMEKECDILTLLSFYYFFTSNKQKTFLFA